MFCSTQPPLTPDEDTARDWVLNELGKPEYQQAKPPPFEQFFADLWDWFTGLFDGVGDGLAFDPVWVVVIIAIISGIVLLVLLGRPRAIAARRERESSGVFLDGDDRTARELREAAVRAEAAGDISLAFVERYRAICRSLQDRTLITLLPGDTAQAAARSASRVFPEQHQALQRAASGFDTVRYFERTVSEADYAALCELDETLERTKPQLAQLTATAASAPPSPSGRRQP
nr:DUF4129 domain-containing protein [Pseudoclavibacter sp. Marseille-Q3772]